MSTNPYVQGLLNQLFGLEGKISVQTDGILNYFLKNSKNLSLSDLLINEEILPFFQDSNELITK